MIPEQSETKTEKPKDTRPIDTSEVRAIAQEVISGAGLVTHAQLAEKTAAFVTKDDVGEIVAKSLQKFQDGVNAQIDEMKDILKRMEGAVDTLINHRDTRIDALRDGHDKQESRLADTEAALKQIREQTTMHHMMLYGGNGNPGLLFTIPQLSSNLAKLSTSTADLQEWVKAQKEKAERRAKRITALKAFLKSGKGLLTMGSSGGAVIIIIKILEALFQ